MSVRDRILALIQDNPEISTDEIAEKVGISPRSVAAFRAHVTMGTYTAVPAAHKGHRPYKSRQSRILNGSALYNKLSSGQNELLTRRAAEDVLFYLEYPNPQAKVSELLKIVPHEKEGEDILIDGKEFISKVFSQGRQKTQFSTTDEYLVRLDPSAKEFYRNLALSNQMTLPALLSRILNIKAQEHLKEIQENTEKYRREQLASLKKLNLEDL